ncbi:MAG TPA: leucine-rich repeat domain-containing protein [Cyclobacteriaceae bacterium]
MRLTITILIAAVLTNCKVDKKELSTVGDTDTTTIYSIATQDIQTNEIPKKVFEMGSLRKLTIIGMDCDYIQVDEKGNDITKCWAIREIPKEIKKLKKLETLELRVNSIQTLPKEIRELKNLKTLDLTDNPGLSNIDNVIELENLEELVLFGCYLTKLPADIGQLKKLRYLGLTGNNIELTEQGRIKKVLPTCDIKF